MKGILNALVRDDNPYTHIMLQPVTPFGVPLYHAKAPSEAGRQEGEAGREKVVKELSITAILARIENESREI